MPRFEEVLELVDGRVGLNIHIKDPGPNGRLVKHVCDQLRDHGLTRLGYIAGDEPVLEVARAYAPEIPRACLAHQDDPPRLIEVAHRYECRRVQFGRNAPDDQIHRAHELGLICNLFWSDDPDDAREYVQRGIDVVLTNAVHKLRIGNWKGTP